MQAAVSRASYNPDRLSDEELVPLARNGDEGAVRALVRRHNQQLFRIARGVVRDDAEAEDVVQATYVRAFTNLDRFRGESLLTTWLTRLALNEAFGRLRRRRPTSELSDLESEGGSGGGRVVMLPVAPAISPETEAARDQMRRVLERAVDELPDAFRLVFILRDIEGLTTEETAARLSIRIETVKTRLYRARRLMRVAIEKTLSPQFSELFPFAGARCADLAERVIGRLGNQQHGRS